MKANKLIVLLASVGVLLLAKTFWMSGPRSPAGWRVENTTPFLLETADDQQPGRARDSTKPKRKKVDGPRVVHIPETPKTAQGVIVTVDLSGHQPLRGELTLEYQVVEPGKYVALEDAAYRKGWVELPMGDQGVEGDATPGDGVFSAELPPHVQKHRRLVRYRIQIGRASCRERVC